MFNLDSPQNFLTPYSHTVFYNVLNFDFLFFSGELARLDESQFTKRSNENFQKKELTKCDGVIGEMLKEIVSDNFLINVKKLYQFENLSTDPTFDGGGLTLTDEGGYLRYHADFPYSNSAKKYRVLNAILYLSTPDIVGGDLHLLDFHSGTVEAVVKPQFGTLLVFPTSKYTIHGFSKILKGKRITINSYLYDDKPIDDRDEPSKTIWFNNFK